MYGSTASPNAVSRDLRRAETQAASISPPDRPAPPSGAFLAATKGELESAIKELVDLNGRLGALADRVFGSQPEASDPAANGRGTESYGIAADIEGRVNAIRTLVQSAHLTVARLEVL